MEEIALIPRRVIPLENAGRFLVPLERGTVSLGPPFRGDERVFELGGFASPRAWRSWKRQNMAIPNSWGFTARLKGGPKNCA